MASSTQPGAHGVSFKTPRLFLRPLNLADAPDAHKLRSDPRVTEYTLIVPETDVAQSEVWLTKILSTPSFNFAMELLPAEHAVLEAEGVEGLPRVVGILGSHSIPWVGYLLNPLVWGRGYASEALKGFLAAYWAWESQGSQLAFESPLAANSTVEPKVAGEVPDEDGTKELDLGPWIEGHDGIGEGRRSCGWLQSISEAPNVASGRVLEKAGFQLLGRGKEVSEEKNVDLLYWKMERPPA